MIVRECTPADRDAWVNMNREFMEKELSGNAFWAETIDRGGNANLEVAFDKALEAYPSIILLILEDNGVPVGFVNLKTVFSVWSNGDAMSVDDFYISEEHRGKGYGQEGLVLVEKFAMDKNVKRIQFHSNLDDESAYKLWEGVGYHPIDVKFYMRYL